MSRSKAATAELPHVAAVPEDKAVLSQKILNDVFSLYNEPKPILGKHGVQNGLVSMAKAARIPDQTILTPRRRVTVLIIGNHSAGKSSFINYYCSDYVQPTSVAVETRGFTIVRSGVDQQELSGEGALLDNEHVAAVANRLGADRQNFLDNLSLLVRTSKAKDFQNVDLVDTPGLCDGEIVYPFDVNRAIVEFAAVADLILVFLDPLGQALVSRTMDVVRQLNQKQFHSRMRYFLTKADSVSRHDDLIKVISQVARNLTQRLHDDHGFELPCLWIPERQRLQLERQGTLAPEDEEEPASSALTVHGGSSTGAGAAPSTPAPHHGASASSSSLAYTSGGTASFFAPENNGLYKLIATIKRTIENKVQANMTTCQRDARTIMDRIDGELAEEARRAAIRSRWSTYTWLLFPLFPLLAVFSFLDLLIAIHHMLPASVTEAHWVATLLETATPLMAVATNLLALLGVGSLQHRLLAVGGVFLLVSAFSQFFKCRSRGLRARSDGEVKQLKLFRGQADIMLSYVIVLYQRYVRAVQTPEYDMGLAGGAGAGAATPGQGRLAGTPGTGKR